MDASQVAKLLHLHKSLLDAQQKSGNPIDIRTAESASRAFLDAKVLYDMFVTGHVLEPALFAELERLHKATSQAHQRFVNPITKADRTGGFTAFQNAQVKFNDFVKKLGAA